MLLQRIAQKVWWFISLLLTLSFCYHVDSMLSRFSHVRLYATPWTAGHQAPLSLGFSRQEHWSGLPFPSPMHESESEVAQSCLTLSDPMDCSLPGSSVHGIFQARVLEWGAIAFSDSLVFCKPSLPCSQTPALISHQGKKRDWWLIYNGGHLTLV